MLGAMAGYDPEDPTTSVLPVPPYLAALNGEVKGLRIGLLRSFFVETSAPEVRAAVEAAATLLADQGAIVDEVTLAHLADVPAATMAIIASEALAYHATWVRTRPGEYQRDVIERLRAGAFVTGVQYVRAQQLRVVARREVDAALARRDVLLAPTVPITAPRLGQREVSIDGGGERCPLRPDPLHAALQPLRTSGVLRAMRLQRHRPSPGHAVRRSPVRRGDGAARGRCLPAPE
jgi:aspartyl-tRNA(Asn)/glutamyl-tRNA(Gln) amidotransferase subunit A